MAFGGVEVVKGIDLELRQGEVHALVGENGAGKSTVAKIVAGVHRPVAGSLELDGKEVRFANPREAISKGIALIHQEPLVFPDLDVAENIFVGHQPVRGLRGVDWRAMRERADHLLRELGANFSADTLAGGLSVADQQLVELAAAMSHEAQVLVMDETTASLTPKEVEDFFAIVRRLRAEGRAIVFIGHRLEEVLSIADRITVMRDGERVGSLDPEKTDVREIVSLMVGREPGERAARRFGEATGEPLLEVTGLSSPGRFQDVSFKVRPGEIVGLAGLVGAGRTEVCEAIFGADPSSSGSIRVGGREVRIRNPREAVALGLAMVPEDRQHGGLMMPASIVANTSLPTLSQVSSLGWVRHGLERERAARKLESLRLVFRNLSQPVRDLSGGNQQKVVLAKWLLAAPKVLILDEPTRGVDVGAKEEVHRAILELADQGIGILLVSSDLPEVLALADRILVMREGRLVAELRREEATAESVMLAATGQVPLAG